MRAPLLINTEALARCQGVLIDAQRFQPFVPHRDKPLKRLAAPGRLSTGLKPQC